MALALSQIPHYIVEDIEPGRIVVYRTGSDDRVQAAPRSAGKQGWSFDADTLCRVVTIEAGAGAPTREDPLQARLMLRPHLSQDAGVELAGPSAGFSSPAFSPDGHAILFVRGGNELVMIELPKITPTVIGTALFAFWGVDGSVTVYEHLAKDCHRWRRFSRSGKVLRETRFCGGYSSAAIASGAAPTDAPVPIIDKEGRVVALLGIEVVKQPSEMRISTAERGLACSRGVDYVSEHGEPITLSLVEGKWAVRPGQSCTIPIENRRGRIKVVSCP